MTRRSSAHVDRTPPLSCRDGCQHGTPLRRGDRGLLRSTSARLEALLCEPCRCGENPSLLTPYTRIRVLARQLWKQKLLSRKLCVFKTRNFHYTWHLHPGKIRTLRTAQRGRTRIVVCVRESTRKEHSECRSHSAGRQKRIRKNAFSICGSARQKATL